MVQANEARICEPGGEREGLFFPLMKAEQEWPWWIRAFLYAGALVYLFMGVNIVADKFMGAIESITSKKRQVKQRSTGRTITVQVWNDTIANLTLMALGSSAPEILLSIVEIGRNGFHSGELGPSTIVGSAAFNLFMIIAVCIVSIPSHEVRQIKETGVFGVTAVFSLFAYFWLIIIVQVTSPEVVEIWEGLVTLAMMPVLLLVSYLTDIGYFVRGKSASEQEEGTTSEMLSAAIDANGTIRRSVSPLSETLELEPVLDKYGRRLENPAGVLTFGGDHKILVGGFTERSYDVEVFRRNGCIGEVSCKYRMERLTAIPDRDYVDEEGELHFENGVDRKEVPVKLLKKELGENSDQFQIILEDPQNGACFDPDGDGGSDRCVLTVTITNENDPLANQSVLVRASRLLDGAVNVDSLRVASESWYEEIKSAIFGDNDGNEAEAQSSTDKLMHVILLPWKFVAAVAIPPAAYAGGWVCFVMSLGSIGLLTAVIIDFAELFGCVAQIEDSITAITFVALGTSIPDLFASTTAATQDEWADASIVNVTGSNSVNVFLGIGIPWTIAAIYWALNRDLWLSDFGSQEGAFPVGSFIVSSGNLAFSVIVFAVAALICLAALKVRRERVGGELGGPYIPKVLSFILLVLLWVFYIALSCWKVAAGDVSVWSQVGAIALGVVILENILLGCGLVIYLLNRTKGVTTTPFDPEKAIGVPIGATGHELKGATFAGPAPVRLGCTVSMTFGSVAMAILAAKRFQRVLGTRVPKVQSFYALDNRAGLNEMPPCWGVLPGLPAQRHYVHRAPCPRPASAGVEFVSRVGGYATDCLGIIGWPFRSRCISGDHNARQLDLH